MDPSGVEYVYTDTSTCTDDPCSDESSPESDSDSNGSFSFCRSYPIDYTEDPDQSDFLLSEGDTDYMDWLDDPTNTEYVDNGGDSQQDGRTQRQRRSRKWNKPFWRHLRKLHHQNMVQQAIQQLLQWKKNHPVKSSGGS